MLSFRSIILLAAALATVASAIPTPETSASSTGVTNVLGGLTSGEVVPIGSPLKRGQFSREFEFANNGLVGDIPAKVDVAIDHTMSGKINNEVRDSRSYGDFIKQCHDDIEVIVVKIDAAVKVKGGADHGLIISLLGEIVVLLQGLLHDLKLFVNVELLLGGVAITLQELAVIVNELLVLVVELVWLVLSIVGFLDVTLLGVIATIGGLLYEILGVVFGLVEGLLVLVVALFEPYGAHCKYVRYTDILVLLGIKI